MPLEDIDFAAAVAGEVGSNEGTDQLVSGLTELFSQLHENTEPAGATLEEVYNSQQRAEENEERAQQLVQTLLVRQQSQQHAEQTELKTQVQELSAKTEEMQQSLQQLQ